MTQNNQLKRAIWAGMIGLGLAASFAASAAPIKADVLYHEYCSVCHGDRGDGNSKAIMSLNPPPRDLTKVASMPRDYLLHVITNGKPGTAMVGYKSRLNGEQLAALADYVQKEIVNRSAAISAGTISGISGTSGTTSGLADKAPAPAAGNRTHGAGVTLAPVSSGAPVPPIAAPVPDRKAVTPEERADMKLGFPSGLKGDAGKGEAFYLANCAECHGAKGDGQGKRAYFIRPVPRDFLDERSRLTLNRPALYAATFFGRNGTEMPAWGKVLSEQEIANVSEFVFRSFILPGQQAAAKAK